MTFKDRAAQIIELLPAVLTPIPLTIGLMCMKNAFVDRTGPTLWTTHPAWPAHFMNDRKAFRISDQVLDV